MHPQEDYRTDGSVVSSEIMESKITKKETVEIRLSQKQMYLLM